MSNVEIEQLRVRLRVLTDRFASDGIAPAVVLETYENIRLELERLTGQNLSMFAQARMRSELGRAVLLSSLLPAIDQILIITDPAPGGLDQGSKRLSFMVALLDDQELRTRCADLLALDGHFDRVIQSATTVFEDRLRNQVEAPASIGGTEMVNKSIKSDYCKSYVQLSANGTEQAGFADMCRGLMALYRNKHHHQLVGDVARDQALKVCLMVDEILRLLAACQLNQANAPRWG